MPSTRRLLIIWTIWPRRTPSLSTTLAMPAKAVVPV